MSLSEEHLRKAVDDVLEPAWEDERRRAAAWHTWCTLGRVVGGMFALGALGLVARLVVGLTFPWTFWAFVAGLVTIAAFHDARDPAHLRRHPDDGDGLPAPR
jgi:hypothetical protein